MSKSKIDVKEGLQPATSSQVQTAGEVSETIHAFRICEAIKEGDLDKLMSYFGQKKQDAISYSTKMGNLLHFAASFGSKTTFQALLEMGLDLNTQNADGNTPLHLAARLGRQEIVDCILADPSVDDTLLNKQGLTGLDLSKNKQISSTIECNFLLISSDLRKLHISKETKEMFEVASHGNNEHLRQIFSTKRNQKLLDVNAQDSHGNTILHYAAKRDNLEAVQLCLDLGVDPFVKNEKGKIALVLAKEDAVKALLKEAPMTRSKELPLGRTDIRMEGTLLKWTNYAGGYKKRWFVLEEGVLSYYKSQFDYPVSCRGSLNLKFSSVTVDPADKFRFDVTSANMKFCLRAEHAGDTKRWVMAMNQAKQHLDDAFTVVLDDGSASKSESATSPSLSRLIPLEGPLYSDFIQNVLQTAYSHLEVLDTLTLSMKNFLLQVNDEKTQTLASDFHATCSSINKSLQECIQMCEEREKFWKYKLERETQRKKIFVESLEVLAEQNNELEQISQQQFGEMQLPESEGEEEDVFFEAYAEAIFVSEDTGETAISFVEKDLAGYAEKRRSLLPFKSSDIPSVGLWSVLKNAVGKDLSRLPIPVNYNEPLSMLQRMCEDMEYSELIDRAFYEKDPLKRIQLVAAFAMSNYSSTDGRTSKPFNPLLGETFEYVNGLHGYRYISEQVSHHPPISACFCESKKFVYWSEVKVSTTFWGKSLELIPTGVSHLVIKDEGEGGKADHYSWKKVTTQVNNVIIGKLWIDHYGDMTITSHNTGNTCVVTFKPSGWRGNNARKLEGRVMDESGRVHYELQGYWHQYLRSRQAALAGSKKDDRKGLTAAASKGGKGSSDHQASSVKSEGSCLQEGESILWSRRPLHPQAKDYFNYTPFTFELNELSKDLATLVCPTDSRLRPDQRAMEQGDLEKANDFKLKLEAKQRAKAKKHPKDHIHVPRWFHRDIEEDTNEEHWVYNGGYWESRESRTWRNIPEIFLDQTALSVMGDSAVEGSIKTSNMPLGGLSAVASSSDENFSD